MRHGKKHLRRGPEKPHRTFGCRVARPGAVRGARMENSVQLYGGDDRERDRRTERWRLVRIARFTEIRRHVRKWINFAEIAEWCSEESGIVPNAAAQEAAYQKLQRDLLEGDFEENGRSQILYLHPYTMKARMTRDASMFHRSG
jgi:hypothetical protein